MNLGTKGQQDGETDPSGYSSPGKSCHPPRLTPGFLLPSSLSFCFSFLGVIWNMGAVILQNVPQLENGSLSIHRLSSMAQGWGEGQQEGMFQRPRPKAPQRKKFISTQRKVSRASPPWGRRGWSDRHPEDLGQDTQQQQQQPPEGLTGPVLSQASATHTFLNPRDSLRKREAELLKHNLAEFSHKQTVSVFLSQRS